MAWSDDDVARSIRRYLGMMLEEPWTLRTERRQVADEERPVASVILGQATVTRARSSLEQGEVETMFPVTISCYPEMTGDEREMAHQARLLNFHLQQLFVAGLELKDGTGRHWAGPFHIPLWDYADVPVSGPDRAGPEWPHDVIWVQRPSLQVVTTQDPEDDRRYSVIAEFRGTVEGVGRVKQAGGDLVTGLTTEGWDDPPRGP